MELQSVKEKYPHLIVQKLPIGDYDEGIRVDSRTIKTPINRNAVYVVKDSNYKFHLLYPYRDSKTGSFNNWKDACLWFRGGGR